MDPRIPLLIMLLVGMAIGFGGVIASMFLGPSVKEEKKNEPYECGIKPTGTPRIRFSVRFFVVALLFLVFDVEVVLLFPWAVQTEKLGVFGLVEALLFIGILVFGYIYAWGRRGLEWK